MKIDQSEFAGAKGIFFLNPGNFEDGKSLGLAIQRWFPPDSDADDLSPEAKAQIAVARSAITNALYRYMVQKRGTEEAADKFGKLVYNTKVQMNMRKFHRGMNGRPTPHLITVSLLLLTSCINTHSSPLYQHLTPCSLCFAHSPSLN
jgi:hypothetical protein